MTETFYIIRSDVFVKVKPTKSGDLSCHLSGLALTQSACKKTLPINVMSLGKTSCYLSYS